LLALPVKLKTVPFLPVTGPDAPDARDDSLGSGAQAKSKSDRHAKYNLDFILSSVKFRARSENHCGVIPYYTIFI